MNRLLEVPICFADHKSKLAICAEMEWIGSESDNVIPFKEMCLRNIGTFYFILKHM